jgi:class 3 adenylate cyclase/ligand-binding sensor domain-containing protein
MEIKLLFYLKKTIVERFKFLSIIVSILFNLHVYSQEGTPLITNFSFGETSIDNESWAMTQDGEGQMMFANRRGIVSFDGMKWNTISTPSAPLSLYYDVNTSQIFVGCKNNIGLLIKGEDGIYQYATLVSDGRNVGDVETITALNDKVYFYSSEYVTCFSLETKKNTQWAANAGEGFTGFFTNKQDVYVNVDKLGLHRLKGNTIVPVRGGEAIFDTRIKFFFKYNKSQVLIGTDRDSLYMFSGSKLLPFKIESDEYIHKSILAGGINLDANCFVLSTINGGCLVIDKKTKKTIHTLNYQTGLPDDEIYSMGVDQNNGLWVLHEYGMSRVDLKLPIRNVNHYPGLEGNLTSIIDVDSSIYVSTSEGVYYLTEVKNFEEIEVLVKINKTKREKEDIYTSEELKKDVLPSNNNNNVEKLVKKEKRKGGIWNKIFKKRKKKSKNKKKQSEEVILEEEPEIIADELIVEKEIDKHIKREALQSSKENLEYESKKIYALQSISHKYNKIKGIDSKVKQLLAYKDVLLVAANTGLYEINNFKATQIIKDRYINFIFQSKDEHSKFYVGTSNGLLVLRQIDGSWVVEDKMSEFSENVYSVLELDKNNLWIGAENVAYSVLLDNAGNPVKIKPYTFETDFTERILVRSIFNIPYFFLSTGLYNYNQKSDSLVFNSKINQRFKGQSKYIFSQNNITWVFNNYKWMSLHENVKYDNLPEEFLELFDDISNIYIDSDNNIWIIDNNNSIYKMLNIEKDYNEIFDIYLNFVVGKNGKLLSKNSLQLDFDENSLSFNISAPYFVKSNAITFQYYIEGLNKGWSDWSKDHDIDLPYLPNGDFTLHIKAKNILGKETDVKTFKFSISPPFYKRWWFYFIGGLGFLLLGVIILRLRERQLRNQKKILEEKIEIRTKQLQKEKGKTEELLLNILPRRVAEELKVSGKAEARTHNFASVLFTDFKGFTFLAEKLAPKDLVNEIDYCFSKFDDIVGKFHIEKIKTIGDAYMCAGGVPEGNPNNPILITLAGLEIANFMGDYILDRSKNNLPYFELRIGIHTGSLISGVVGKKKFAYDIWGDTVNTASRLESSGEVGMVNVSEITYEAIKDYFECEFRGNIEAKNKGEIAMYFVKRIKPKFSDDKDGEIPNEIFKKLIGIE